MRHSNGGWTRSPATSSRRTQSTPYYHARTISYDDAARYIDRLSGSLAKVVSEIRSLQPTRA